MGEREVGDSSFCWVENVVEKGVGLRRRQGEWEREKSAIRPFLGRECSRERGRTYSPAHGERWLKVSRRLVHDYNAGKPMTKSTRRECE